MMFQHNSSPDRSAATSHQCRRGLRFEPLEHRNLLAVDGLAAEMPLPDRFESAEELSDFLVEDALARYGDLFGQEGYPWGWYREGVFLTPMDDGLDSVTTASTDHSDTNVQVAGVDEADLVETDGEYLYMLSDDELLIVDVRQQDSPRLVSQTPLEGNAYGAHGMYLNGDRVTVISQTSYNYPVFADPVFVLADMAPYPYEPYQPTLTATVFDVSDRTSPEMVQEIEIDGNLVDSRAIGESVVLVTSDNFGLPHPEMHEVSIEDALRKASADIMPPDDYPPEERYVYETKEEYLARIEGKVLELALPLYTNFDADGSVIESGLLAEATDIYRPWSENSYQLTSIVTIDMGAETPGPASVTSLPGTQTSEFYMSMNSLYLADYRWNSTYEATIFKFDIDTTGQSVDLSAVGTVPGHMLNQFSIDEYDGYLRVATTQGWQTENALFVLQQNGESLDIVGNIEGIAPGERIYSARFMGDRAFVVTFRQTDPLFSIDLSDPTAPEIMGELHVPGFSNYLHPVDGDHLLGIGRNADETTGLFQDPQISLFDVGDMTAPELLDRYTIELGRAGSTEAFYDHHAVGYYPEYQILAVPVTTPSVQVTDDLGVSMWSDPRTDLWVFQVDVEAGTLEKITQIEHESKMRRSVRIGEYLYAISEGEVTAHLLTDMTLPGSKINIARAPMAVVYDPMPLEIADAAILTTGTQEEPLDLGSVDYRGLILESPEVETLWYEMTAVRDGTLTVTGLTDTPSLVHTQEVDPMRPRRGGAEPVSLYRVEPDGSLELLDSDTGRVDYDAAVAGQRYVASVEVTWGDAIKTWVDIANVVVKDPSQGLVDIYDAQGEDNIDFLSSYPDTGNPKALLYNFVSYYFDTEEFTSFVIHDVDSISMSGAYQQVDHLESSPLLDVRDGGIGRAILSGDWGSVEAHGTDITVHGDAADTATFSNHGLEEVRFDTRHNSATMSSAADATVPSSHRAFGFGTIEADASGMGVASLEGSDSDDTFSGGNHLSTLVYANGTVVRAENFLSVDASGGEGSRDVASLFDSTGDDTFVGTPDDAMMTYADGTTVRAVNYDYVHAYARRGGHDSASLTGTDGNDNLVVKPIYARLVNQESNQLLRAKFFESVVIDAAGGRNDYVRLYDTPGNDTLTSRPGSATFLSENLEVQLNSFEHLAVKSNAGGVDVASLYDSPGNDRLIASPTETRLYSSEYTQRVRGFDAVHTYAVAGGTDSASLYGSLGNDSVIATSKYVRVFNNNYVIRAKYFERVNTDLRDGFDNIRLSLGSEKDLITASPTSVGFSENSATQRFDYIFSQLEYARVNSFDFNNDERDIDDNLAYQLLWG